MRPDYVAYAPTQAGLCAVSAARYEVSWLDSLGLPYVAYQHSDPSQPHYHRDLANEAAAYLQFVIDYYNCLPQVCPDSTLPL